MRSTYKLGFMARTLDGSTVKLADVVARHQRAFNGQQIPVLNRMGDEVQAILRGDLYGLDTPGTGDPVVELIA